MEQKPAYKIPNIFAYTTARFAAFLTATFIFRRKIVRNELRGHKGPCVVIANHECALDFVNLIGITGRRMTFVFSKTFYGTLPFRRFVNALYTIPKQQFQPDVGAIRRMKETVRSGGILAIYPAGMMSENGLSTPIPPATYGFLRWLGVDVFVARTTGAYLTDPKWGKGFRPGRTFMDVYRLIPAEALASLTDDDIRAKVDGAILFNEYKEQEEKAVLHRHGDRVEGLQNVLYQCPDCETEFSIGVLDERTLSCEKCGYEARMDKYGFLRTAGKRNFRYVSEWSGDIYRRLKEKIRSGAERTLTSGTDILCINEKTHRFEKVGEGTLTLTGDAFTLVGELGGENISLTVPIAMVPAFPFTPGKCIELQNGSEIYRCALRDGRLAMKFETMLRIFFEERQNTDITYFNEETPILLS